MKNLFVVVFLMITSLIVWCNTYCLSIISYQVICEAIDKFVHNAMVLSEGYGMPEKIFVVKNDGKSGKCFEYQRWSVFVVCLMTLLWKWFVSLLDSCVKTWNSLVYYLTASLFLWKSFYWSVGTCYKPRIKALLDINIFVLSSHCPFSTPAARITNIWIWSDWIWVVWYE